MDDTHKDDGELTLAAELGALLKEHKGGDVVIIDLRPFAIWTDFFIIATVTSNAHLAGLQRHIKEFADEKKIDIFHRHRKSALGDEWDLCDLGGMVIHLMTERARSFYELENLWSEGKIVKV
jgi:ribosome-associated protein